MNDIVKVCTMPGPEGWSAVTSAADFGFVDVLKMFVANGMFIVKGFSFIECCSFDYK